MAAFILFLVAALLPEVLPQNCIPSSGQTPLKFVHVPADRANDDYFYIGGMFGVHEAGPSPYECGKVRERGIQNLEAFIWAIGSYGSRLQNVLDGIDIGGIAFDSCSSEDRLVTQLISFENCFVGFGNPSIEPNRVFGYVGPDRSSEALRLAPLLGQMKKITISHAATSTALSNPEFKYFLRTVPSDAEQIKAIIGLVKQQNWRYIQVVYSMNSYGQTGLQGLLKEGQQEGICITNMEGIPSNYTDAAMDSIVDGLREESKTSVVVMFANDNLVREFLKAVGRKNARGEFTFIGSNSWGINERVVKDVEEEAEGAVTFTLNAKWNPVDDFRLYYSNLKPENNKHNPWFNEYWQEKFNCYLPGEPKAYPEACDTDVQSLTDFSMDTYVPYTIMAVDAIIKGVDLAKNVQCPYADNKLCSTFMNSAAKWDLLKSKIYTVQMPSVVQFNDTTGDNRFADMDMYNYRGPQDVTTCANHCYTKIGTYNTQGKTVLNEPVYYYGLSGERIDRPTSVCSRDPCTNCGAMISTSTMSTLDPSATTTAMEGTTLGAPTPPPAKFRKGGWVIALVVLAGLGVLFTFIFEIYLMSKMFGTPVVKHWRTMWLGQLLLLAIFVSYLTLFAFVPTPTRTTCAIIRFGVGGSYAMIFSVLLVKLMIILSSKNVGYLKGVYQVLMFIFAWGVQLVLDAEWLILRPPHVVYDNSTDPARWVCSQGFVIHVQTLVYVMFLIAITTIMAMRAHGIITNHREGIFIGLTAGFTIPIFIGWVLLGMLSNNPEFEDPVVAFGLLIIATMTLFIMYLPKVRQLNSMGVEGIYAEDDAPDYTSIAAPSVAPGSIVAGSVMYGPPSYKSKNGSMVFANGGVYAEPPAVKPAHYHYEGDQSALYLRHPGVPQTERAHSVRSAPVGSGLVYTLPRRGAAPDSLYATTRVLRMTGDLSGRKAASEYGINDQEYGTLRSNRSGPAGSLSGTLRKPRSLLDLGSL